MLSALQQGSLVYIIDKTKDIKYLIGEVVNKTEPAADYSNPNIGLNPPTYFDLIVKVDNETYKFQHLNASLSVANSDNAVVSETKEGLTPTVENILHNSKKIIDPDNIQYHTQAVASCEEILKKLNPVFAKDKERDERIQSLEDKVTGMDDKLDKIFNLINKQ